MTGRHAARVNGLVRRAFTLLEMMIVLTILAIVAGSLVPVITRPYVAEYRAQTLVEMQALESAIVGHPEIGDYGFIGTMGRLPNTLKELWIQGSDPAVTTTTTGYVPIGWNGPYLRSQFIQPDLDAWGNAYRLDLTGGLGRWRIVSNGPDGVADTADDIFFPAKDNTGTQQWFYSTAATLTIDVLESDGLNVAFAPPTTFSSSTATATLSIPVDGAESPSGAACSISSPSLPLQPSWQATVTCTNVPFGLHHLSLRSNSNLFLPVEANIAVTRHSSYARIFLDPSGGNTEVPSVPIPTTATLGPVSSGATATVAQTIAANWLAPMSMPTMLDIEVTGTITPSDATTTCNAYVLLGAPVTQAYGLVSVSGTTFDTPFRISVNPSTDSAASPVLPSNLFIPANSTTVPQVSVVVANVGGSGTCSIGSTKLGAAGGIQAVVLRQMAQ